jgi:SAM-dependent methyltransferase
MREFYSYLDGVVPRDHSGQATAPALLERRLKAGFQPKRVLDFGCGNGRSIDLFARLAPFAEWNGVDIEFSPEVASRTREDGKFFTYDGVNLPFASGEFDLIYSFQVLEHCRKPEAVLGEIRRCLNKGGLFIGQTSQFEPYHSYSLWNFTVYGFKVIMEDAGLRILELRPGIDGFTLMRRTYENRPDYLSCFFSSESPVNWEIEQSLRQQTAKQRNLRKLHFSGHFVWVAEGA